jgi:hypothetical protein
MNAINPPTSKGTRSIDESRRLLTAATVVSMLLALLPFGELVTYPIRIFVTFVHEGSHALAALITGGTVRSIDIYPSGSGVTWSSGGLTGLITMAGYIGTMLFGCLLLLLTRRRAAGRTTLALMAGGILFITLLWTRNVAFGVPAGLILGLLLFGAATKLPEKAAAFTAAFLSLQLVLNALFDVRNLVWMTTATNVQNDAVFMAERVGGTPWMWAVLWAGASAAMLVVSLRAYWKGR